MICETCHGEGKVWCDRLPATGAVADDPLHPQRCFSLWEPCPDCGGCGFAHAARGCGSSHAGTRAPCRYIRSILARAKRLFSNDSPSRATADHITIRQPHPVLG